MTAAVLGNAFQIKHLLEHTDDLFGYILEPKYLIHLPVSALLANVSTVFPHFYMQESQVAQQSGTSQGVKVGVFRQLVALEEAPLCSQLLYVRTGRRCSQKERGKPLSITQEDINTNRLLPVQSGLRKPTDPL